MSDIIIIVICSILVNVYVSDILITVKCIILVNVYIVKPKKGKALLWPSTLSENPEQQDIRTMHEARPVVKGIKFAANSWIHLYNFMEPNLWGCTGTFDEY